MIYPNKREYDGLIIENISNSGYSKDMVVALLSPKRADNSVFELVSDESVSIDDKHLFTYGKLLDRGAGCAVATTVITIKG